MLAILANSIRNRPRLEVGILDARDLDVRQHFDAGEQFTLFGRHKHPRHAISTSARRATDAVDVDLWIFWHVVVDDVRDVVDIKAARRKVTRDKHAHTARA